MKLRFLLMCFSLLGIWIIATYGAAIIEIPQDSLESWFIEGNEPDKKIILLDVRDDSEVAQGVIASSLCQPYHISVNYGWNSKVQDLPQDIQIIVYCRSGARARRAAAALIDSGFDTSLIAVMAGGYASYSGTKTTDSSLIKPWSSLPEPSNSASSSVQRIIARRRNNVRQRSAEMKQQLFNLKGQRLNQSLLDPQAPVYILEQIGGTRRQRISGIRHLIQRGE